MSLPVPCMCQRTCVCASVHTCTLVHAGAYWASHCMQAPASHKPPHRARISSVEMRWCHACACTWHRCGSNDRSKPHTKPLFCFCRPSLPFTLGLNPGCVFPCTDQATRGEAAWDADSQATVKSNLASHAHETCSCHDQPANCVCPAQTKQPAYKMKAA